ncbi:UDP-N-acetylmuramoyl-tripeptide--D-alanyl-D-alanine ligase [Bacillus sp. Marseille-P3661]|uniref:UDP-N-acetylmuramoyl-tripeptide--D-alanyl-D- alanine ligase n=1 Tax=Bacillus sp. Marseille-P3661 TaxID=1936234 RepID=UPI000C855EF8|nr:UDP-N-acetylmuramoyl-tripeptide--D-alanyl-D-alanine ligase [Bacillus sp. Marseille-P3661]
MKISLNELTRVFPIRKGTNDKEIIINEIMTDSRKGVIKGLFVPIVGDKFDGHNFLKEAINNGAIATLWQEDKEIPAFVPNHFPVYFVKDTLQALQTLSKFYLDVVNPIVIGITGSNGKTTTKDLVDAVLQKKYKTFKTQGNFNNHIGLPLTILAMPERTEALILEMGMNHFGEISFLSQLAKPSYAIITNIGESHIEYLGSRAGIAKAKLEILDGLRSNGKVIVDGDEPLLRNKIEGNRVIYCGFESDNNFNISDVHIEGTGINYKVNDTTYNLPLIGNHNAKNASFAIALAIELGISATDIQAALNDIEITSMRLQQLEGKNGSLFINDAYNSSPTSMIAAIETVKSLNYEKKVLVLGDMYELGTNEEQLHRSVAVAIKPPITDLITIGDKAQWIADECLKKGMQVSVQTYPNKAESIQAISKTLGPSTVVLFKASRGVKLETVIRNLMDSN